MLSYAKSFRFFKPGIRLSWTAVADAVGASPGPEVDALVYAVDLVDSAADFYRGMYMLQTPHDIWGEGFWLPWYKEYVFNRGGGGNKFLEVPIHEEVAPIARALIAAKNSADTPWDLVAYFCNSPTTNDKSTMQEFAVEAMLSVDNYLSHVSRRDFSAATPWLTSAYRSIIECTCQAHMIMADASTKRSAERRQA